MVKFHGKERGRGLFVGKKLPLDNAYLMITLFIFNFHLYSDKHNDNETDVEHLFFSSFLTM